MATRAGMHWARGRHGRAVTAALGGRLGWIVGLGALAAAGIGTAIVLSSKSTATQPAQPSLFLGGHRYSVTVTGQTQAISTDKANQLLGESQSTLDMQFGAGVMRVVSIYQSPANTAGAPVVFIFDNNGPTIPLTIMTAEFAQATVVDMGPIP